VGDLAALVQGGVVAAVVSAVTGFLAYRAAMRQAQVQAAEAVMTADELREERINTSAEKLRLNLLQDIDNLRQTVAALEGRITDQRKHIDDQDRTIFELRKRVEKCEGVAV
jgi:flagellar motility protein MotE (MotC chaperone)